MVTNWFDETTKELSEGDSIQKSYRVELNGHMGYLTLTNERVIFLSADGFFKKTYKKKLDLRYDEIKEIYDKGNRTFDLIGMNVKSSNPRIEPNRVMHLLPARLSLGLLQMKTPPMTFTVRGTNNSFGVGSH